MLESVDILGNGCDSSQHQRTSRTNSIQSIAVADYYKREQKLAWLILNSILWDLKY